MRFSYPDLTAEKSLTEGCIVVRYIEANGIADYKNFKTIGGAIKSFCQPNVTIGGYGYRPTTIARNGVVMAERDSKNVSEFCANMREEAKRRHGVIEAPALPEDTREQAIFAYWNADRALTLLDDLSIKDSALREHLVNAVMHLTEILAPGEDGVQICTSCSRGIMQISSNERGIRWDCDNGCGEFILDDEYKLE